MIYDYADFDPTRIYKLISQTIIPRPIAWIVTEDGSIVNIAPFSYFTPLSSNPPLLIVSIGHKKDGSPKDTLANIRKTKKATICFVNEINLQAMQCSAEALPKEVSESNHCNIDTKKIIKSFPPMITSSQSALFCELFDELDIGSKTIPLILKVKHQYLDDDTIDANGDITLENIARVGKEFAKLEKI